MKAFALESTDKPASLISLPKPGVGEDGIRIAVRAASVNGIDVYQANGYLAGIMEHALPTVVGRDFAGVVEAVGSGVHEFAIGDEVFGFVPALPPLRSGAFAEYVSGGSELVLARKPAGLDFHEAAALPLVGSAALDLLEVIDGDPGDLLLVVGATGGVGTIVVQLAAQRGLTVIATARAGDEPFICELGASDTIDYTVASVADAARSRYADGIDAIIDLVSQRDALTELASVVRSGGHVATLMSAADVEQLASRGITGHNVMAVPTREKLDRLGDLAASGTLRVPIQNVFSLDRTGEALAAFQQGTRGKLIVRVGADEGDR
jgi:NADPH:quinone reductase